MGCAAIAAKSMIPAIKQCEFSDLTAVASRTEEKARRYAAMFGCIPITGYDSLLSAKDIDAVYMPLPTGLHEEWILKSLVSGKHILAEKSLGMDFLSTKKMIDVAREKNLLVIENFMFQYHSQHVFVKDLIARNEIGKIHFFKSSFGFPPLASDNFRYNKALGGGVLLDAAGYPVKAAQMFLGKKLTLCGAFVKYDQETGIDIYGGAVLKNHADQIAHLSFSFDNYYQCNYEIWGTKGKIVLNRAFTPPPDFAPTVILEQQNGRQEFNLKPDNHFVNILSKFCKAIHERNFGGHYQDCLVQAGLLDGIRSYDA